MNMAELKKLKEERKAEHQRMIEEMGYDALRMDLDAYIAKHYVPDDENEEGGEC